MVWKRKVVCFFDFFDVSAGLEMFGESFGG